MLGLGVPILFAVELEQLEQIRDSKRPEQHSEQTEVPHSGERADESDHRMNVGYPSVDERADQIVDVAGDAGAGQCA